MADVITEVHSICAASGWQFPTGEPVVCFALVSTVSDAFVGQSDRRVIPLSAHDMGRALIGDKITALHEEVEPIPPSDEDDD